VSAFEFVFSRNNQPFAIAIGLVVAFFLVELVMLMFGGSISGVLDDIDAGDVDAGEIGASDTGPAAWLLVGTVPTFVLLVIFCLSFGLSGYIAQWIAINVSGKMLPWYVGVAIALASAIPLVRLGGKGFLRTFGREDTEAVHSDSLIGRTADVVLGEATVGKPTQAKVTDQFGQHHYILVEPTETKSVISAGETVILVARHGSVYQAVSNNSEAIFVESDPDSISTSTVGG
jgi:hypothetical protein